MIEEALSGCRGLCSGILPNGW